VSEEKNAFAEEEIVTPNLEILSNMDELPM
jgi:hypothetical protein